MTEIKLSAEVEPWEIPLLDVGECDGVGAVALIELHEIHKPAQGIGPAPEDCD